jgi:ATP-dependent RNA helicase HelY
VTSSSPRPIVQPDGDPDFGAFAAGYPFALDAFQRGGVAALQAGLSTLVAAPTGAGKTVVGEFAAWHAVRLGVRCFYTTPIKALSNQKYADFRARHGDENVGLLTGDNSVNGDAPIVVMTTEVLRNMLYEGSDALDDLRYVVLDEVHYLADRARGAVWEEVIVQLSAGVQLACLSATVSNAEEFGAWLAEVRDGCDVLITENRPVPLEHSYAINERILPVFATGAKASGKKNPRREQSARQAKGGRPNPEILMLERRAGQSGRRSRRGRPQGTGVRLRPPRRSDVVMELRRRRWLPAIYFLFSRAGCDGAVGQLLDDGIRLNSSVEAAAVRDVVDAKIGDLPAADLDVLGYGRWAEGLERGIAAHHAGMVPIFKETVEELFIRGLVKVCFATETLALGINMPARTVVIERLEKWNGQQHVLLTPGQFTQLTGRAGRRGLDTTGHAVVLYQRDVDFPTVASLVGQRVDPLRSSFAPSYNMAVNLLRRHARPEAEELLARSFAQYQLDAGVAELEQRIARNREALAGYAENLTSDRGEFEEYWSLRRELSHVESRQAKQRKQRRGDAVEQVIAGLRPGDVITTGKGGGELGAVVSVATSRGGAPLASVVNDQRRVVRIGPREYDRPPQVVGRIGLPRDGGPRNANYRKLVAQAVRGHIPAPSPTNAPAGARVDDEAALRITELREAIREHPVHHDPELERWAYRTDDLRGDTEKLARRVRRQTGSLVATFDRIVGLLADMGYLTGTKSPAPTGDGVRLSRLYADTDLLLAECLRAGLLDDLAPADLAALASVFVYEWRSKDEPELVLPNRLVADRFDGILARWEDLTTREESARLPVTREPDPLFADTIWQWAAGADLDEALGETDLTAGDFVRSVKQVADLLRQIRDTYEDTELSTTAGEAARRLVRGVVAFTGL